MSGYRNVVVCLTATTSLVLFLYFEGHSFQYLPSIASTDFSERLAYHQTNVTQTETLDKGTDVIGEPKRRKGKLKVVLITYGRSGSTMTASLLQYHAPVVFYMFEPLAQMGFAYKGNERLDFLNGSSIYLHEPDRWKTSSLFVPQLRSLFECRLEDMAMRTFQVMIPTKGNKPFSRCTGKHGKPNGDTRKPTNQKEKILSCLPLLSRPCNDASVIFTKVIRLTMAQLDRIMEADNDVMAIHLLRDPRGTLLSQKKHEFKQKQSSFEEHFLSFCQNVSRDVSLAKELISKYPNRMLTIRYEDVAEYTHASAEFLYRFLGMKVPRRVHRYVENITTKSGSPCPVCVYRQNATKTAYQWRDAIPFDDVLNIQDYCSDIFDVMGYRKFNTKAEVKDHSVSSILDDFGQGYSIMKRSVLKEMTAAAQNYKHAY